MNNRFKLALLIDTNMLNEKLHFSKKIFKKTIDMVPTRNGYGEGLVLAGEKDPRVVALCADLSESTRTQYFANRFPDRFIEVGVAEQLLVTLASGIANYGKIPFVSSYAAFSPGRNWEQIFTTIALNNVPVKIAGAHAGISVGPDGATHQRLEDIALMRVIPNMTVIAPCDSIETKKAVLAAVSYPGPVYLRFAREKTAVFTTEKTPFQIGKAYTFFKGSDVSIIACGTLVYEALLAAKALKRQKIYARVINCHTIKPLDEKTILAAAKETGAIVSVEEHQVTGGLGSALSEFLVKKYPIPQEFIGMPDTFGESGKPGELLEKYGMTSKHIIKAVKCVLKRKKTKGISHPTE